MKRKYLKYKTKYLDLKNNSKYENTINMKRLLTMSGGGKPQYSRNCGYKY